MLLYVMFSRVVINNLQVRILVLYKESKFLKRREKGNMDVSSTNL